MASERSVKVLLFAAARTTLPNQPTSLQLCLPSLSNFGSTTTVEHVRQALRAHALEKGWENFIVGARVLKVERKHIQDTDVVLALITLESLFWIDRRSR